MRPGPDDDERDMAENFDEWLEDEAKGCTTPPNSTTPPETVHDKLDQFVADVQQKGWVSTERMRAAHTAATAQVAQAQSVPQSTLQTADADSEAIDTSNDGGDPSSAADDSPRTFSFAGTPVASASSRTQDLLSAASASSSTLKEQDSKGGTEDRKRAASDSLHEPFLLKLAKAQKGRNAGLLIATLPAQHEPDIVAAPVGAHLTCSGVVGDTDDELQVVHATVEWNQQYYAAKSGELLDTCKVWEGRQRELDLIERCKVKRDMPISEAEAKGIRIVNAKWQDDKRPIDGDAENVRSRLVATEPSLIACEDRTQAIPPCKVLRFLISTAATKVEKDGTSRRLIARYDVAMSVFCNLSDGRTAVMPPEDLREWPATPGVVWFLEKAMYGTRQAARLIDAYVINSFQTAGLQQIDSLPMTFVHPELDLEVAVHGDDFVAEGVKQSLDAFDVIMERFFNVRSLPRIGLPECGGETSVGDH